MKRCTVEQGSAAAEFRCGGSHSLSTNPIVKESLKKSYYICQSYCKK